MINRILRFYTKWFALWVLLFAVIAYFRPGLFKALGAYNQWFFALTMFGLGTVLALKHFGEKSAIPVAMFVFVCILTASVMAEIWQRNKGRV